MNKFIEPLRVFRRYRPYIRSSLDLGFLGFHTELMHRAVERDIYNYIEIRWFLFKWNGHFSLYKPGYDYKK